MNGRAGEHPDHAEARRIERAGRLTQVGVWLVAVVVMVYGAGNVTRLMLDHHTPRAVAWMLSPAVDVALIVGLLADGVLGRHGVRDRWSARLRRCAGMLTLTLNVWSSIAARDFGGAVLHAVGPVLLFTVAEAAAAFRLAFADIAAELRRQTQDQPSGSEAERDRTPAPSVPPVPATGDRTEAVPVRDQAGDQRSAAHGTGTTLTRAVADLLPVGRQVAKELAGGDPHTLTRAVLVAELRRQGYQVGTTKAGDLLRVLRSAPDRPALAAVPDQSQQPEDQQDQDRSALASA
jgi:hypothetical protein